MFSINLMHLKYAVEVAKTGSINKAAEKLYIGQPNLSRAIKELESSLGVAVFERCPKGMIPTAEGETFLKYAKKILKQVDEVEGMFKNGASRKKRFSVSVPRASYIADAFARFSKALAGENEVEAIYKETNSMRTLKNVQEEDYKLGIVRYAEDYDRHYKSLMDEKELEYEVVTTFSYVLLMNKNSTLAEKEDISFSDLEDLIEIAHADPFVPSLPTAQVKKDELPDNIHKRIFVFERASQFELLSQNPQTFMWVSPIPDELLGRYGLVQRRSSGNTRIYKDVLIRKKGYQLSELDMQFITELCRSKRENFNKNSD
ncbi:MAG: LysR family transcriptional regulator [Acutalibacteraceae bacterium]